MSTYVSAFGKGLGKIWEDKNWGDHVLMGSALPGAFEYGAQRIVKEHKDAFDYGVTVTEAEEKAKKDTEAANLDRLYNLLNQPAPERPQWEEPTYEAPAIPQWTPPPTTSIATAPGKEPSYTPRRTTTVLTQPGSVTSPTKGKKKLLGE
jgi:hypothetical protein